MEKAKYRAVKGDTLKIQYGKGIQKNITIGSGENPGLEYACVGKCVGNTVEYLDTFIWVKGISPALDSPQDIRWVPKVMDFFHLPRDIKSTEYEEIKFGIVNDITEWKLDELKQERKRQIERTDGISETVRGYNTVRGRKYQQPKSAIDNEISAYRLIRKNPYGVRLDYYNEKANKALTIYIGEQSIRDRSGAGAYVLGWKNTFQQISSQDEEGRIKLFSYSKNGSAGMTLESLIHSDKDIIEYNGTTYKLLLKRMYEFTDLEHGVSWKTDYDSNEDADITDSFLRKVLQSKRRQNEVTSIVYSIQDEQRKIMYRPLEKNVIVQGCAGSGKTMILMHRISVLIGETAGLSAENILILTPNEIFTESLGILSHTLEISKTIRETVDEYYQKLVQGYLPEYKFEGWLEDETELYDEETLKRAYTQETFDNIAKFADEQIAKCKEEIEKGFAEIADLLKRNKIKRAVRQNAVERYLISASETLNNLYQKLEQQRKEIREIEKSIDNDKERVGNSQGMVQEAEEKMLRLLLKAMAGVEERRKSCIEIKHNLEEECEDLTEKLTRSISSRNTKGYIDEEGNVDLIGMEQSEDIAVQELAQKYKKIQEEVLVLEDKQHALNRNDIKGRKKILEEIENKYNILSELYDKIPKISDVMILTEEKEVRGELEKKQKEIVKNTSCISACEKCLALIHDVQGKNWPDLGQVAGHELLQDLIDEYQLAWETIRVQTGRAENITKQIHESEERLLEISENQPSKEENKLLTKLNGELKSYSVEAMINESMIEVCDRMKINPNAVCHIQLLFLLQLCDAYFKKQVKHKIKLLCIDEAQDVSVVEIALLKKILGENVYWNLYGDYMQVSREYKGQPAKSELWRQMENRLDAELYTTDINYRNAQEIVEYCNSVFNTNVTPMGLNGEVFAESFSECIRKFAQCIQNSEKENKAAIIVKECRQSFLEMVEDEIESFYGEGKPEIAFEGMEQGKISYLDVSMAKGMEFRYVLVDPDGMTENEKYIAYTRAMEKLFIVEES